MPPLARDDSAGPSSTYVAGCEWIVDASGCLPELLRSAESLRTICELVVRELELQIVGEPLWRTFPEPGGVTGLSLLTESHLACHTWPEYGLATFNLFCCRRRREWPWESRLQELLGATSVSVRMVERGGIVLPEPAVLAAGGQP